MDSSGPLRSARPQPFAAVWLVGMALALPMERPASAAEQDPSPPFSAATPDAGPAAAEGDGADRPPDDLVPLPDDPRAPFSPPEPFPPGGVDTLPPFTFDPPANGPGQRPVDGVRSPGDSPLAPVGGSPPVSPDGTVSVLVQSAAPAAVARGGTNGPFPPSSTGSLPLAPPRTAFPPPSVGLNVAPPPSVLAKPAADLVARGLELPFPLVAGSPTADIAPPRPLALLEALERSGDRTRRLWITQAYWKLAAAAARVRFAAEAEERLALVAPGGSSDDLVLLDLATATARGESASAGVELVAAQQEIIDLVRLPVTDPPPWPVDRPLTAAYQTHFDTIFAGRPATGRVRAIHRQLPLHYAAVVARAEAATAAERRFTAIEALHAQGSQPIGAVLSAHDAVTAQGEAFVRAVRGYNLDISEYVMAVADLSVPDEQFAMMLIGQPTPWRQPMAVVPPFAGNDRVVPVAGQSFSVGQPPQSPDVFPAGTPILQTPPAVGLPGANPLAPGRFAPPPNAPGGAPFPPAGAPFGG